MGHMNEREFREFVVRRLLSIESSLMIVELTVLPKIKLKEASVLRKLFRRALPKQLRAKLRSVIRAK